MDSESEREEIRAFVRGSISQITKLEASGDGFLAWKFRVKLILDCAELWDVVDPDGKVDSREVSPDGVSNEERKREARAIIQSAITFHIKGNRDPRECWIYLKNRFAPNTPARRQEFRNRLWSLRMKEGGKVEEFFNKVEDVLWHLEDMGVVIDEKELVSRLVLALPRGWHIFASIFWQEIDTLTKDELYKRMISVETRNELRAQIWRR